MSFFKLVSVSVVILSASMMTTGCKFKTVEKDKPAAKKPIPKPPIAAEKADVEEKTEEVETQAVESSEVNGAQEEQQDCAVIDAEGNCVKNQVTETPTPTIIPKKETPVKKNKNPSAAEEEYEKRRAALDKKVKDNSSKVKVEAPELGTKQPRRPIIRRRGRQPGGKANQWAAWMKKCMLKGLQPDPSKHAEQGCQSVSDAAQGAGCPDGLVKHPNNNMQCVSKAVADKARGSATKEKELKASETTTSKTYVEVLKTMMSVNENANAKTIHHLRGVKLVANSMSCEDVKGKAQSFPQTTMVSEKEVGQFKQKLNLKSDTSMLGVDLYVANVAVAPVSAEEEINVDLLSKSSDFEMCNNVLEVKLFVKVVDKSAVTGSRVLQFSGYVNGSIRGENNSYKLTEVGQGQANNAVVTCMNEKCETMAVIISRSSEQGASSDQQKVTLHAFSHKNARKGFLGRMAVQLPVKQYSSSAVQETSEIDPGMTEIEKDEFADMLSKVKVSVVSPEMNTKDGVLIKTNLTNFDIDVQYPKTAIFEQNSEKKDDLPVESLTLFLDALKSELASEKAGIADLLLGQRAPVYEFKSKDQTVDIELKLQCFELCDKVVVDVNLSQPIAKSGEPESRQEARTQYEFEVDSSASSSPYLLKKVRESVSLD